MTLTAASLLRFSSTDLYFIFLLALARGQISPFPSCDRDVIDACAREATTDSQGNTDEKLYEMLRVSFGTNNMGDPVNPVELCRYGADAFVGLKI